MENWGDTDYAIPWAPLFGELGELAIPLNHIRHVDNEDLPEANGIVHLFVDPRSQYTLPFVHPSSDTTNTRASRSSDATSGSAILEIYRLSERPDVSDYGFNAVLPLNSPVGAPRDENLLAPETDFSDDGSSVDDFLNDDSPAEISMSSGFGLKADSSNFKDRVFNWRYDQDPLLPDPDSTIPGDCVINSSDTSVELPGIRSNTRDPMSSGVNDSTEASHPTIVPLDDSKVESRPSSSFHESVQGIQIVSNVTRSVEREDDRRPSGPAAGSPLRSFRSVFPAKSRNTEDTPKRKR